MACSQNGCGRESKPLNKAKLRSAGRDDEDGAGGFADDAFGDVAVEEFADGGAGALAANHQEVGVGVGGVFEDLLGGFADEEGDFEGDGFRDEGAVGGGDLFVDFAAGVGVDVFVDGVDVAAPATSC